MLPVDLRWRENHHPTSPVLNVRQVVLSATLRTPIVLVCSMKEQSCHKVVMPFILFETYFKSGEWHFSTVPTDRAMIDLAWRWLHENKYKIPQDESVDSMISTLLECGNYHIINQLGWGYVKVYRVQDIQDEWEFDG